MTDMRDHILNEIRRLTIANDGKAPGSEAFEKETGIKKASWYGRFWARWGDAVREAGYTPNTFTQKMDSDSILEAIAVAVRHFRKMPSDGELRLFCNGRPEFPSHSTFHKHFKTKVEMTTRLREWASSRAEFADVAALLPAPSNSPVTSKRSKTIEGIVYLIQSGPHYKIGRSDELERRIKEIRIALPDAAVLVHSIVTDDPAGIEAYWHRRFADRRANGEWFKLTPADIVAFKRRRFQ